MSSIKTQEQVQHFNIALYPNDSKLAQLCTHLAQINFKSTASEYLLGESALPHITLCQLKADSAYLPHIWSSLEKWQFKPISIRFHHLYIWSGTRELPDYYWVGLAVTMKKELLDLQRSIFEALLMIGITSNTSLDSYFPHLTFARCHKIDPPMLSVFPPEEIWLKDYTFNLTLARSDQHGVYHERLFPQ